MKVTDNYVMFWGSIFSQWNSNKTDGKKFQFEDENGKKFSSCEQYMMYGKALLFNDQETANRIMNIKDVKEIKQLGREVKNFDNKIWDDNKFDIVVKGNYLKFTQNKEFKRELLKYKDKEFVEASPKDRIWGIGLHYDDVLALDKKNWKGENLLGKAITKVKDTIILELNKEQQEISNYFER